MPAVSGNKELMNAMDLKVPAQNKLRKIFGAGPTGAIISLFLFATFVWADSTLKLAIVGEHAGFIIIKTIGILFVGLGVGLHFWSFFTLRNWWVDGQLCKRGPFKYFRHPMYAAWITFICPGIALYLNSWLYFFWVFLLHLIWHKLVKKEEIIMINTFGERYKNYARQTGRFFPKRLNLMVS